MVIFVEAALAFLFGMIVFFAMPLYTFGRTSNWFVELALNCVRRGILLKRLNSGFSLKASRFNADDGTEQISVGGQTYDIEDPRNYMSRFKNKPFGIAHEKRPVIVTPRIADIGRRLGMHLREGTLRDDQGRKRRYFAFEKGKSLVNIDHVLKVIQGSAPPQRAEIVREYTRKGQSDFNTSRAATFIIWAIMYGVGAGVPYVLLKLKDTLGQTTMGSPVPGYMAAPAIDILVMAG